MPDILRILPTGGTYKEFKEALPSGGTVTIGAFALVRDTYAIALSAAVAAEQAAAATAMAAGIVAGTAWAGGGIVGTVITGTGTQICLVYEAEKIMLPKKQATGEAFSVGDDVWLDTVALLVSPIAVSGYLWVGTCQKAAGDNDERVLCSFEGNVTSNN
ncbi:MAG TPA: hypothetical protein VMW20_07730 [Candidatus Nanoarchaeia archaeon]|nr:hypothetical protein [Candidatus Nanoarchaeia archaeon]